MRKNVFGIIYASEEQDNLRDLTDLRSIGALPIGARYRIIDFVLSNLVHSGIRNIGVLTRKKYHSLMDHLGSGKDWDLNRKSDGLLIIPPFDTSENFGHYRGVVDTLKGADSFIRDSKQEYCLLANTDYLHTANYEAMYDFHVESGADITMLYCNVNSGHSAVNNSDAALLDLDERGRVREISMTNPSLTKQSMSIFLAKKDLLQYIVSDAVARQGYDLTKHVLMNNLSGLKIYGFEHKGYVGHVNSVASYYKTNMDFLRPDVQRDLFHTGNMVFTKVKDEVPTKYDSDAKVKNSLIGSGCLIEGEVENSIIFRGVKIAKGTTVKNSIIMQSSEVYTGANLNNVILDKTVTVRPNATLSGCPEYPIIIPKVATV